MLLTTVKVSGFKEARECVVTLKSLRVVKVERLHKFMAYCGIASRRKCEELISRGIVKVNG